MLLLIFCAEYKTIRHLAALGTVGKLCTPVCKSRLIRLAFQTDAVQSGHKICDGIVVRPAPGAVTENRNTDAAPIAASTLNTIGSAKRRKFFRIDKTGHDRSSGLPFCQTIHPVRLSGFIRRTSEKRLIHGIHIAAVAEVHVAEFRTEHKSVRHISASCLSSLQTVHPVCPAFLVRRAAKAHLIHPVYKRRDVILRLHRNGLSRQKIGSCNHDESSNKNRQRSSYLFHSVPPYLWLMQIANSVIPL